MKLTNKKRRRPNDKEWIEWIVEVYTEGEWELVDMKGLYSRVEVREQAVLLNDTIYGPRRRVRNICTGETREVEKRPIWKELSPPNPALVFPPSQPRRYLCCRFRVPYRGEGSWEPCRNRRGGLITIPHFRTAPLCQ